ncbi:hypothetical protein Tco_1210026 [Tanacetum coccineum]
MWLSCDPDKKMCNGGVEICGISKTGNLRIWHCNYDNERRNIKGKGLSFPDFLLAKYGKNQTDALVWDSRYAEWCDISPSSEASSQESNKPRPRDYTFREWTLIKVEVVYVNKDEIGIKAKVIENRIYAYMTCIVLALVVLDATLVMSSVSSVVTYTSVYTDSEPDRAFWGADDEEISEGGIPRVIVLGYDGLPIQPVAPPSPDYIPGPEDPQTPPVPQDEDEREPMFEQPLPPVDSPTAESPGYVTESDPEEDLEEYEDDETEDGPVDYPMDGGDDGDDDDGDSSRDDANDEDEDEDGEDEEEHLAPADSAIIVPVFPPKGT